MDWLGYSGRTYQKLMTMLADRSSGFAGDDDDPEWAPPRPGRPESDRSPEEQPAERDRQDRGWGRRSPGGAATAGRNDREAARLYRSEWPGSCRNAGVPVNGAGWYVVAEGDTLWSIAEAHYGYGGAYRRIWRANRDVLEEPDTIYRCQRLYIPHWSWCGCHRPGRPPWAWEQGRDR
jgi:hypothetical protein